jgi:anti-sigma-K factor RskA
MSATHDEQSLAAPYVLGALDAAERRAFEAHLATCLVCQQELRTLQPVADALALAVPQRTPRPELRQRVLASAPGRTSSASGVSGAVSPRTWLPLAASILLAAVLGAVAWRLQTRVADLEARVQQSERRSADAQQQVADARRVADDAHAALAILSAPDLVRIDLAGQTPAPGATARALWSRENGMVFTAADLPPAPAGRVYQVWVVTADAPVSAGLLTRDFPSRAAHVFRTPRDIGAPVAAAVTLEPEGGVPAPTGEKYLVGTLHRAM